MTKHIKDRYNNKAPVPLYVKIGSRFINTVIVPEADLMKRYGAMGTYSDVDSLIEIADRHSDPHGFFTTYLHELIHAIYATYNLRNRETEERVAHVLSEALTQILLDNPDLKDWIREETSGYLFPKNTEAELTTLRNYLDRKKVDS